MTAGSWVFPQARRGDDAGGVAVHPPKVETFDPAAMINVDPKGVVRSVDEYEVAPFGLYLARPMPDHPKMSYLESWLLPDLDLRITDFYFRPGHERDQDFYLDVALVRPDGGIWYSTDLYLDLVLRTGARLDVVDTDELLVAVATGQVDQPTGQRALDVGFRTATGLGASGYDLAAWLADQGIRLHWRRHHHRAET